MRVPGAQFSLSESPDGDRTWEPCLLDCFSTGASCSELWSRAREDFARIILGLPALDFAAPS